MVTLQVPSSRITAIDYRFKPDYGNWLTDAASRMQDAGLGGGFQYLYPMCFGSLPKNTKTTAPEWHREGTDRILQFDGIANYLVFPVDAFPTGPFTLEFEAKTDSAANQALFRHAALDQSSLDTYIVDGYLRASFAGMGVNFNSRYYELPVKLAVSVRTLEPGKNQLRLGKNDFFRERANSQRSVCPASGGSGGGNLRRYYRQ